MAHTEVAERYSILLGNRGRVVLPAAVRRRLDLQEGDRLILSFDDEGSLRLISARQAARRTAGIAIENRPVPARPPTRGRTDRRARRAEAARE